MHLRDFFGYHMFDIYKINFESTDKFFIIWTRESNKQYC